jgi:hypothetical protein
MRFFLTVTLAVFLFGSVGCVTPKPGQTTTATAGSDIVAVLAGKLELVEYGYSWRPRFYYIVDPRTETCWFTTNNGHEGDTNSSLDCCKARRVKELRKVITRETDESCQSTTTSTIPGN